MRKIKLLPSNSASASSHYAIEASESAISPGSERVTSIVKGAPSTGSGNKNVSRQYALKGVPKPSIIDTGRISANDVADYFLSKNDETDGELISNLKLQKLLYYAQGFHLAITGRPLFPESIEAWIHGPVVPIVYHRFKGYGYTSLPATERPLFDEETTSILDEVYQVYGQFSAWKLRDMTHEEPPWKSTAVPSIISHVVLRSYFKTLLA